MKIIYESKFIHIKGRKEKIRNKRLNFNNLILI